MLKRFFPDRDGDGKPDVPPGLKFRFGPNGQNAPNNDNGSGERRRQQHGDSER